MRIRFKTTLIATVVSASLLTPAMAAVPAEAAPASNPEVAVSATSAQTHLEEIDALIARLQGIEAELGPNGYKTDYGKEIRELLATAWELRDTVIAIAAGGVPPFNPITIVPRIQLLTEIADTIRIATTEFTNKTNDAHVQLGFAITRAVIRLGNPSGTVGQIKSSIIELGNLVDAVRDYPDLTASDTATIYVKARLDKAIWQTRVDRDKYILGKVPFNVYHALNRKITHAVGVWMDPTATVQDIDDEIAALNSAYETAFSQLP
ncbi:MAG: CAMP factor family pore-forming toxin [Actinomycetaceae bacterium]|nr:CAMP factor family pore-forming toxin [Actinomycetaceae bacterium]